MSGGVVKAAGWHLGVALALEELGFTFKHNEGPVKPINEISTYVGSSAGSLIGLYLACGYRPIEVIAAFMENRPKDSRLKPLTYMDLLSLKRPENKMPPRPNIYDPLDSFPYVLKKILNPILTLSGIFSTQGIHDYIIKNVITSNRFEDLKADLFVVATQLDHSRKVIFSKYNYPGPPHDETACYYTGTPISESITASMSVPPFYSPYPIQNPTSKQVEYYIDGEIRETLSTHVAVDNKCDFVISSWTHTPYHYHDEIGSLVHYGLPAICMQALFLMIQKKIVASRQRRKVAEDIINTVNKYLKSEKIGEVKRKKIISILERKLHYQPNVRYIDIFPKHDQYKLFFTNSFSLNPATTSYLAKSGYKRTMEVFRQQEEVDNE